MPGEREHPAPWRWTDERGDAMLVAADHVTAAEENDGEGHGSIVLSERMLCLPNEMSPTVRELVRAAPQLRDLVRKLANELRPRVIAEYAQTGDPRVVARSGVADADAVLARLDAAAKG